MNEHKESNLYSYCSFGFGHSVIAFSVNKACQFMLVLCH